MTVLELITRLQEFPPDLEVEIVSGGYEVEQTDAGQVQLADSSWISKPHKVVLIS